MTFDDWFVKSSITDSMKHDLFDCWFQALVSRDPEVSELRQQVKLLRNALLYADQELDDMLPAEAKSYYKSSIIGQAIDATKEQ